LTIITIASIEVKEKRSVAITTEKRRLGFWQDQAAKLNLQIGGTYEVETTATEINGKTLVNIVKAKQIGHADAAATASHTSGSSGNGHSAKDEQIWVQGLLQAMIKAGKVEVDKQALWSATQMLRGLWRHTFGFDSVHQHLEAAE